MSELNNQEFYVRREAVERKLAARAIDPRIAAIHVQMADEYAGKVMELIRPSSRILI